jgi:hypothetical protein
MEIVSIYWIYVFDNALVALKLDFTIIADNLTVKCSRRGLRDKFFQTLLMRSSEKKTSRDSVTSSFEI